MHWRIRNGRDRWNRRAPVSIDRDVFCGAIAEGAGCCELLCCPGDDSRVRRGDRDGQQGAGSHDDRSTAGHAGYAGRDG